MIVRQDYALYIHMLTQHNQPHPILVEHVRVCDRDSPSCTGHLRVSGSWTVAYATAAYPFYNTHCMLLVEYTLYIQYIPTHMPQRIGTGNRIRSAACKLAPPAKSSVEGVQLTYDPPQPLPPNNDNCSLPHTITSPNAGNSLCKCSTTDLSSSSAVLRPILQPSPIDGVP